LDHVKKKRGVRLKQVPKLWFCTVVHAYFEKTLNKFEYDFDL